MGLVFEMRGERLLGGGVGGGRSSEKPRHPCTSLVARALMLAIAGKAQGRRGATGAGLESPFDAPAGSRCREQRLAAIGAVLGEDFPPPDPGTGGVCLLFFPCFFYLLGRLKPRGKGVREYSSSRLQYFPSLVSLTRQKPPLAGLSGCLQNSVTYFCAINLRALRVFRGKKEALFHHEEHEGGIRVRYVTVLMELCAKGPLFRT